MSDVVLKYPGAKWRIADWILQYFPEHKVYCELFFGSGALLFKKTPSYIETANDIDSNVTNFFTMLRTRADELVRAIKLTPYARDEYYASYEETTDELERARRFAVRSWQSYGGSQRGKNGFRTGIAPTASNPATVWSGLPEVLAKAAERLNPVQIENLPALELIGKYNNKDTLLYADPPYLPDTRSNKKHYKHEMDTSEHETLLKALLQTKSKVILSGYDHELYNDTLKGWTKFSCPTTCEQGLARNEVIWCNYDIGLFALL